jgi:hypothetical protein
MASWPVHTAATLGESRREHRPTAVQQKCVVPGAKKAHQAQLAFIDLPKHSKASPQKGAQITPCLHLARILEMVYASNGVLIAT